MLFSAVIDEVRRILQDEKRGDSFTRYSDAELDAHANQALNRIAIFRPDLFYQGGHYLLNLFETGKGDFPRSFDVKDICPEAFRLVDVLSISLAEEFTAITEIGKQALDGMFPQWVSGINTEDDMAAHFIRNPRSPTTFYLYPSNPKMGSYIDLSYVASPTKYESIYDNDGNGVEEDIRNIITELDDVYFPVVVDATVFVAESRDDEAVSSGRAELFYRSFTDALGVNLKGRITTDVDVINKQVIQGSDNDLSDR